MHHPVHPHSQEPGRSSEREGGQHTAGDASEPSTAARGGDPSPPATGPFSGSAENGYRPSARVNVPNPYTTRRVSVDDVDTGATPVGQWRGAGLNEPEPRTAPHIPATTDTMTDTPSEHPEPSESSAAATRPSAAARPQRSEVARTSSARHEAPREKPSAPRAGSDGTPPAEPSRDRAPDAGAPRADHRSESAERRGEPSPEPAAPQAPSAPREPRAEQEPQTAQAPSPAGWTATHPAEPAPPTEPSGGAPHEPAPHPPSPQAPAWNGSVPQAPAAYQGHQPYQQAPAPVQGQYGYAPQPGAAHDPYAAHGGPYQQAPGAPYGQPAHWQEQQRPPAPRPDGYAPGPQQHGGYPPHPQAQHGYAPQPAPYPAPYPPVVAYQSPYPAPYQPPGYVLHGQPVFYPGQYNPYGQPVQHVIVLTAGQQPQVISAESASTLFAEHSEPTADARGERALPRSEREEETEGDAPAAETAERDAEPRAEAEPDARPAAQAPDTGTAADEAALQAAARSVAEAASEAGHHGLLTEALAGLAMRDLSLVDALLEMVEELETDAKDPDLLDKLFQIDNFATRMRRNGENFLVLTGHDGGESDAHDEIVPLLDVARAASSEIKDYPRVRLGKIPQTSITGMAADDISHLLAELLDNATANSPEHSQVVVSAQELSDGRLMIVVEDEGVGIPEAQLAELNERLSGEPVLDDDVPRHMGLYVASRIAKKHGLETRLESRSFRGVSAYTIIPKELLRVATPRTPGQARTSTVPMSASAGPSAPAAPPQAGGPPRRPPVNGSARPSPGKPSASGTSAVTAAGLPRRSATPHGSPLRAMPRPGQGGGEPPKAREDTPPKLTGEARAQQIRDELGDFFDGEREAREGSDSPEDGQK
ncbi:MULTISPECIES: ATP-binding protein [unclassified Nocardiopsis]|uniref:ATP-binding protein n=1 Tax=unclassified Nocardiopsis TaxID=2649073 RepID=UPI001F33A1FF|nr:MULTISPECIES: ATP-binding protein [unclassified Nocardiopsis]